MIVMEDEVQEFDSLFYLMEDTNDDKDEPVNLLDIKVNLKNYSLSKLKALASVLIDSMNDLTKNKEKLEKYF